MVTTQTIDLLAIVAVFAFIGAIVFGLV